MFYSFETGGAYLAILEDISTHMLFAVANWLSLEIDESIVEFYRLLRSGFCDSRSAFSAGASSVFG